MIPPSSAHDHRVLSAPDGKGRRVGDERFGERRAGLGTLHEQLAHVREVEEPGALADRAMLLEDAGVLDRHHPATELDHPRAQRAVTVVERAEMGRFCGGVGHEAVATPTRRRRSGARKLATASRSPRSVFAVEADPLGGAAHERALRLEGEQPGRVGDRQPADVLELAVVARQVAAGRLHQEVVHGLVDACPALDEPVLDGVEGCHDPHLEAGLLRDLAQRRLLGGLAGVRRSLGSVHVRPSGSRRRQPTTNSGIPS